MEILLREMKYEDAEQVMHLSKQLGYDISLEQTEDNLKYLARLKDNELFVAVHDSKIIGWIHVAVVAAIESLPFYEIRGVVVDEQYRHNKTGKLLVEKVKQWCSEKHYNRLRVRSNIKRKDAHAFYTHLGFIEMKEQKVFEMTV